MKKLFIAAIAVSLLLSVAASAEPKHLTILHFNDLHGHVEQASRLATKINEIRAENEKKGWITLVLNGGDLISGTPISSKFGGKAEVDFLNALKLDAFVIGNHDFDFGRDVIGKFDPNFPVLAANIVNNETGGAYGTPFIILTPDPSLSIAIFGITHPDTPQLTTPQNIANLSFDKSIPVSKKMMNTLIKKSNVQIALTHEGVYYDVALANAVKGLDAVIGGHNHVMPSDYCREVKKIPVCQTPANGAVLGKVDFEINGNAVRETSHELVTIDGSVKEDPKVASLMHPYLSSIGKEMKEILVIVNKDLVHGYLPETTPMGNLVTTIMKDSVGAEFGLINTGGIRGGGLKKGPVTRGRIEEMFPFPNTVVKVSMTGKQLEALFREAKKRNKVFQLSGLTMDSKLDPKKEYTVATIDFFTSGGENYRSFKEARFMMSSGKYVKDVLIDYLRKNKKL